MPILLGGEPEFEQARQRFGSNARTRVCYLESDRVGERPHANGQRSRPLRQIAQRVPRVGQQVPQDLDQFVAIQHQARNGLIVSTDDDIRRPGEVEGDRVVEEFGEIDLFTHAAATRVRLLGGDDPADVLDVGGDVLHFGKQGSMLGAEVLTQLRQVVWNFTSARIVIEKGGQSAGLLVQQFGDELQVADP